ncbi:MAG: guanine-specific ribonuclease N1 and T1 [Gallionellaceae bacterium]|nr:MAG: guanine-specific ribonuclease N1 and T1 [Gallionellaceae bacterium]
MPRMGRAGWWVLAGLLLVLSLAQARSHHSHSSSQVSAQETAQHSSQDSSDSIALAQLPPEGRETLQLIKRGGPFPYPRDGVVFSNFERILPKQQRGYYHEYTVKTPGVNHRGARRIVCGVVPECYYTADHYKSFQRIVEAH